MEILPELKNRPPRPPFADHFCHFYLEEFQGYFDSMRSLDLLCESSPRLGQIIQSVTELLEIPRERIGCTGSLAYGYYEEPLEDVDSVFFGTVREIADLVGRIRALKRKEPDREVIELGKPWPLRFKHMGTVICPFFKYAVREEIPLREFRMEVIREPVRASGVVADDRHTAYLPAILTLDDVVLDGSRRPPIDLVIYDGSKRGEYFKGMRLEFNGRLVSITRAGETREALLATMPGEVREVRKSNIPNPKSQ
jgi:predicted nucleotidyltransferase